MTLVLPLVKADEEKRLIFARATAEEPDKSREILDYLSAKPEFEAWSKRYSDATLGKSKGNLRAMHSPRHLAGKIVDIQYDDSAKTIDVVAKILDPVDWVKTVEGAYTGLSIGGGYLKKWNDGADPSLTRYTPRIAEISLVDAPCLDSARIMELQKVEGEVVEVVLKGVPQTFADLQPPRTFDNLRKSLGSLGVSAGIGAARHIGYRYLPGAAGFAAAAVGSKLGYETARRIGGRVARHMAEHNAAAGNSLPSLKPGSRAIPPRSILPEGHQVYHSPSERLTSSQRRKLAGGVLAGTAAGYYGAYLGGALGTRRGVRYVDRHLTGTDDRMRRAQTKTKQQASRAARKSELDFGPLLAKLRKATSEVEREKIHQTLHEFKHGQLKSFRADLPKKKMPKVTDRRQAIAIALSQARRMGKRDDTTAILESIHQRTAALRQDVNKAISGPVARSATTPRDAVPSGPLSDKQHAERIAAAKARWVHEGHHDLDDHFKPLMWQAGRALLGRKQKIAAVQGQRDNAWKAVGDAQDAYDKVRHHMQPDHHLMMEVPHMGGLLYNPEGVGEGHFHPTGRAKRPIVLLHPTEAADWIKQHGSRQVSKRALWGLVTDIRQITQRAAT